MPRSEPWKITRCANLSIKKAWLAGALLVLASAGLSWGFTTPPGPVQNVRTLPVFRHSVEVIWDAPANASEVKAYFLNWQATDGTGLGSKMVPPDCPNNTQVQVARSDEALHHQYLSCRHQRVKGRAGDADQCALAGNL